MTTITEPKTRPLNRTLDRCERCGSEAFIIANKVIGDKDVELLFCGHHGARHMDMLMEKSWSIDDHRNEINVAASISANSI